MNSAFIVYVETNWLVSCVLPHHVWRTDARKLLDAAEAGACVLRIPNVVFLEARHVIERETEAHSKAANAMSDNLDAASRNLNRVELLELAKSLKDAVASYSLANPRQELERLIAKLDRYGFQHPKEEQSALDELRPKIAMGGADITDVYILAAISADRALDPTPPAAVLSANWREFDVRRNAIKLPRDFYSSRRLVYNDKFDLSAAQKQWSKADAAKWQIPLAPMEDARVKDAQKLLLKLPEERRQAALEALQKISEAQQL